MSIIRSTLMVCITILVSVSMTLLYFYTEERFDVVKSKEGIFVFDRKTTSLNYCTKYKCSLINPRFIHKNALDEKFTPLQSSPVVAPSYPPQMGSYPMPNAQMIAPQGYVVAQPWYAAPAPGSQPPQPLLPQATNNQNNGPQDDSDNDDDESSNPSSPAQQNDQDSDESDN